MTDATMWVAYAAKGCEFSAQEQCAVLGFNAHVPRRVEVVRHLKRRRPDVVTSPYLTNYVFIDGGAEVFHAIRDIRELRGSAMGISAQSARAVRAFIARIEADYAERMAQIEAGERIAEYEPGDLLTIMTGPFAGTLARFRRIVEGADMVIPQIEAELTVKLMGREVVARVDPINARRAG